MKTNTLKVLALPLLGMALLSACAPQVSTQVRVHEALLYGQANDHLAWVYGKLSSANSSLNIGGQAQQLLPATPQDALFTPGSLLVGGKAVYASRTSARPLPAASVLHLAPAAGGTEQYSVTATQDITASYLLQNGQWYQLTGALSSGATVQAAPAALDAQSAVGSLTGAEASALARVLASRGALVASVLPTLPESTLKVQPAPTEALATALYLQPLSVVTRVVPPAPLPTNMPNTNTPAERPATFRMVASGSNAALESPSVQLASTQAAFDAVWHSAYGRQTPLPITPLLGNQTAVGLFLGSRATGGYGVQVDSVEPAGNVLNIRVTLRSPAKGTITTQAITSPWAILSVSGQYSQVHVVDQDGNELK